MWSRTIRHYKASAHRRGDKKTRLSYRTFFAEFADNLKVVWDQEDVAPLRVLKHHGQCVDIYLSCLGFLSKRQFASLSCEEKRKHLDSFPEYNPQDSRNDALKKLKIISVNKHDAYVAREVANHAYHAALF